MKENEHRLKSRYFEVVTTVEEISDNRGLIFTNGNYVRTVLGEDSKTIKAIDFEGGPMLYIGDSLDSIGIPKKIKSIKPTWLIEFEE